MNRLAFSSASFAFLLAVPAMAEPALQPHRAYYDLELRRLEDGNNMNAVTGKLAYEIKGSSCDGYSINYRIANRIIYTEGGPQVIDNQMSSWESGDGLELDITQKQFVDSKLNSESRIKVNKSAVASPGKGSITTATSKDFETSAAAIFPTRYQVKLIEAAVKGERRDVSIVYEGSEEEKSMRVVSFIGEKRPVAGLPQGVPAEVSSLAAWPVSIGYYAENAREDEQPLYQASFLMLENGISSDLVLDYGTYALSGKLTKLELLKGGTCP